VADGLKNYGGACCWDFGNATTDNCWGSANALFFGTGYWGTSAGSGPYFMGDSGVGALWPDDSYWACGAIGCSDYPTIRFPFAFGVLKTGSQKGTIRVASAVSGGLTTSYDGLIAKTWQMKGGIVLGIGADNSNSSSGVFFEGAITSGQPTNATDEAILKNVQAAGYGK
jgi:non-reducing end alpha-L-arabinofuranosidase